MARSSRARGCDDPARERVTLRAVAAGLLALSLSTLLLTGCTGRLGENFPPSPLESGTVASGDGPIPARPVAAPSPVTAAESVTAARLRDPIISPGSRPLIAPPPAPVAVAEPAAGGDVTLNFEGASLAEVVKVVLSDLLGLNYVLDPAISGSVTLQTTHPLAREAVLPTLELMLRMNGAALVAADGLYRIVPQEQALRGGSSTQLGGDGAPLPSGYAVRVVPLRYVAATEMGNILTPLAQGDNIIRIDPVRNLLVLAGPASELGRLEQMVQIFDVDWLAGMSVAMYRPAYAEADALAGELQELLVAEGGEELRELVRFVTLERLNAVVAVSPSRRHLDRVSAWVTRLDEKVGGSGRRLFVYQVQNGKAAELAEVLARVFEEEEQEAPPPAAVAPGLEPVQLRSYSPTPRQPAPEEGAPPQEPIPTPPTPVAGAEGGGEQGVTLGAAGKVRIIPDEVNNSLLILSTLAQYREVEAALRQLDVVPLQVLIEATIAEVTLRDELSQGLEWFLKNGVGKYAGAARLDTGQQGLAALVPGFSYALADSAGTVRAVLNLLAAQSRANIVSSPSLMVLNNQEASIRVGDEVPITTQQQQTTNVDATILNSVEYRDTGVLLTVVPRVNPGGLIVMEIEQEVSNVAAGTADTLTPTIQQRSIRSTVAIQSGQTVVLGGLIRDNRSHTEQGLPVLKDLPVLGALFGASNDDLSRTELVVLITPRAVENALQAARITEEFRARMESLKPPAGNVDVE